MESAFIGFQDTWQIRDNFRFYFHFTGKFERLFALFYLAFDFGGTVSDRFEFAGSFFLFCNLADVFV